MKFSNYLNDKKIELFLMAFLVIVITWLLVIFGTNMVVTVIIDSLVILVGLIQLTVDFRRKSSFYNALTANVSRLDQAYLVLETLERPSFLEGQILCDALYEIDKSMVENVNLYKQSSKDSKEYIELWIHEVKLPLSSISLKLHNLIEAASKKSVEEVQEKDKADSSPNEIEIYKKLQAEVKRIEGYVDQVLYFSRSENAEKDYHIAEVPLSKIVHDVAMDNREALQENGIDFRIEDISGCVLNTDQKWFTFMLGQIISNSIKYRREDVESYVKLYAENSDKASKVYIEDNGIGIPEADLKRVFEKTFTGTNGVGRAKSTGMGLYIVKTLSEKLGHSVEIESKQGEWTRVSITVNKNEFFDIK